MDRISINFQLELLLSLTENIRQIVVVNYLIILVLYTVIVH